MPFLLACIIMKWLTRHRQNNHKMQVTVIDFTHLRPLFILFYYVSYITPYCILYVLVHVHFHDGVIFNL